LSEENQSQPQTSMMLSSPEPKSLHVPAAYGEPSAGWTWSRLDDVSEGVFDCPHSTPKLTDTGPYVVRTQDIITGVFRADQAGRVSEETYAERIARVTPSRGDLLYSREGTYFGIAAEVPERTRVCLGQRMVLIRPNKCRLDFRFLRHWLNSPIMAAHIHGYRDGSVAERLNLPTIRALPILIPPLAEQKAIAAVLGALDDKIELNRRMNATLEAVVRALFQSWFVDFDPVRAKLDGRQPVGMDTATAALFPASFQDTPLGEIPNGWRIGTLGELVELRTDRVDATPAKDHLRYIALENMPSKSIDLSGFQLGSAVNSSIIAFRKGDTLFGSMRPYFHKVGLAFFDGITRTTTFVLRPRKDSFRHFALLQFFSDDVVAHATTASVGTTIPYVKWESLDSYRIPIPSDSLLAAFDKTISPLVKRIAAHGEESRTLATLRDTLLPKLLSGELSVTGARVEVEEFR
jgi:type I restriction enzyme S subunit